MSHRFRIQSHMAFVVLIAVGFAAALNATTLWASVLFTCTVGLIATAFLGAIAARDGARAGWAGFAVFGSTYLLIAFGPGSERNGVTVPPLPTMALYEMIRDNTQTASAKFTTTDAPPYGEPMVEPTKVASLSSRGPTASTGENQIVLAIVPARNLLHLRRVVHCLGAIAFGLIAP
jgi:hypothetical protein